MHFFHDPDRGVALTILGRHPPPAGPNEPGPADFVGVPQLFVVDFIQTLAAVGLAGGHVPVGPDVAFEQQCVFRRCPGGDVDPIGHMGDGHFVFGNAGPEMMPHAARHLAMQFADTVAIG